MMTDHIDEIIDKTLPRAKHDRPGYWDYAHHGDDLRKVAAAAHLEGYRLGCQDDIKANEEGIRLAVDKARREAFKEAIGYFEAKKHEYNHKDALLMLLGKLREQAGE
jgi:hypothetical protein